ncbi:MAG: dihydrofolate reductase [Hyphomonadaceae bacterium]|nr:dihydrofolate reductase [Hyphomonadaceae bacterium]
MNKPTDISITLIVAQGANRVIGADSAIPWHLSTDFAHFKAATLGKPVIMGRKTWESLPRRPLPGRMNIVISRNPGFGPIAGLVTSGLDVALQMASAHATAGGLDEICIIGGAQIYQAAMPVASRLLVTDVDAAPDGDAVFPVIDTAAWTLHHQTFHAAGPKDDHAFVIRDWRRKQLTKPDPVNCDH